MTAPRWHVGQSVIVHDPNRRECREATIVKVGRVYFEVDEIFARRKFHIADGSEKTNYGAPARVYTVPDWESMQASEAASRELTAMGIILEYRTRSRAVAILAAVRPVLAGES